MPSSRGSSPPKDQTGVSGIAGRIFTIWATREARCSLNNRESKICLFHMWREFWPTTEQRCKVQNCSPVRIRNSADVSLGGIALVICLSILQAFPDHFKPKLPWQAPKRRNKWIWWREAGRDMWGYMKGASEVLAVFYFLTWVLATCCFLCIIVLY